MKMINKYLGKDNHQAIRYANVWEDSDLLIKGLSIERGHKVMSMAFGGGDNAFITLINDPGLVVAAGTNPSQLHLIALKKEAIRLLDLNEYLSFVGFRTQPPRERVKIFSEIKNQLSSAAKNYWEKHLDIIRRGVVYSGKFEWYLKNFAERVLPTIHNTNTLDQFFYPKTKSDQEAFYKGCWDTWRWRWFFKIYFSKFVMGRLGINPDFPGKTKINAGQTILDKAHRHFSTEYANNNWMLHYCLYGKFGSELPAYVQSQNYSLIKERIDNLIIEQGSTHDVAFKYGKFDRFNLSSYLENMDEKSFHETIEDLVHTANPGSKFAYWNLFVPRYIHRTNDRFKRINKKEYRHKDKGFFYEDFIIDEYVY